MSLSFLPSFPLTANSFVLFGVFLMAGLVGGQIFERALSLPRVTGYIATGMLLGPGALGWISADMLNDARIFVDIALALVLFELGRRLDIRWLRRDRWLLLTGVTESTLTFAVIYFTLNRFGVQPLFSSMAAAIGVATAPAVVLLVAEDLRAEGQVTERALILTAINSAIALLLSTLFLSYVHFESQAKWVTVALHPLYLLAGSAALGTVAGLAAIWLAHWLGKREASQFILLAGVIVFTIGLAHQLKLPPLLTLLLFGIVSKNLDRKHALMAVEFGHGGQMFFVILFVFAGATVRWHEFAAVAWMALAFVLARFAAKALSILALARLNGLNFKQAGLLSLALTPMSGLAIAMVQATAEVNPQFGAKLAAIVFSAVAVLEIAGPLATQFAFKRSGEADNEST